MKKGTSCCRLETTTGGHFYIAGVCQDRNHQQRSVSVESYELTLKQRKQLVTRQNNKVKMITNGYIPRPKGRPRQDTADEEVLRNKELLQL